MKRRALKGHTTQPAFESIDPHVLDPIALRIPDAVRMSGVSRSELYRRAARGELIFRKCGASTLVDFNSLRELLTSFPRATVRGR